MLNKMLQLNTVNLYLLILSVVPYVYYKSRKVLYLIVANYLLFTVIAFITPLSCWTKLFSCLILRTRYENHCLHLCIAWFLLTNLICHNMLARQPLTRKQLGASELSMMHIFSIIKTDHIDPYDIRYILSQPIMRFLQSWKNDDM